MKHIIFLLEFPFTLIARKAHSTFYPNGNPSFGIEKESDIEVRDRVTDADAIPYQNDSHTANLYLKKKCYILRENRKRERKPDPEAE